MQALVMHAKMALYARQSYLSEMTRGLALILVADAVVTLVLKRIERNNRQLAKDLTTNTNKALNQVKSLIQ